MGLEYFQEKLSTQNIGRFAWNIGLKLHDLDDQKSGWVFYLSALTAQAIEEGHTRYEMVKLDEMGEIIDAAYMKSLSQALQCSSVIGVPGSSCPLILFDQALYFYRYWHYEKKVADCFSRLLACKSEVLSEKTEAFLKHEFFSFLSSEQRFAIKLAMQNKLTVITGPPGSGKTTLVLAILAALEFVNENKCHYRLAAPTGKSAKRLNESIRNGKMSLPENLHLKGTFEVSTIHKLLGPLPQSNYFYHHKNNPLPVDYLILDEASMIDLPLMSKILEALPEQSNLLLLGDKNQLSSVNAGSVFFDLIEGDYRLKEMKVTLTQNYRSGKNHGIVALSRSILEGNPIEVLSCFTQPEYKEQVNLLPLPQERSGLEKRLQQKFFSFFASLSQYKDPKEALAALDTLVILTAFRKGAFGSEYINQLIEEGMKKMHRTKCMGDWYVGRPVMITRNQPDIDLYNGSCGITVYENEEMLVCFPDLYSHGVRKIPTKLLLSYESVYAMTIHKSQGSEFDEVVIVTGNEFSPLLTRELLYTAVTRAKKKVEIWSAEWVLQKAINENISRGSGLQQLLENT